MRKSHILIITTVAAAFTQIAPLSASAASAAQAPSSFVSGCSAASQAPSSSSTVTPPSRGRSGTPITPPSRGRSAAPATTATSSSTLPAKPLPVKPLLVPKQSMNQAMSIVLQASGSTDVTELPVKVFIGKKEATMTWSAKKIPSTACVLVFSFYEKGKLVEVILDSPQRVNVQQAKAPWLAKKSTLRVHAVFSDKLLKSVMGTMSASDIK